MGESILVSWDNDERTVLRWDFNGAWTWEDGSKATQLALQMRASVIDHPCVPSILHLQQSGNIPMGALPYARAAIELMDPRDYIVIANASGFVRSLTEIFRLLNSDFSAKVFLAHTLDDARELIAKRRENGEAY